MELTTDEFLESIGSFGRYQVLLNVFCNLTYMFWFGVPVMVMVFIASDPGWKCKNNATCPFTETIRLGDDNYSYRCDIAREDWEFGNDFTSVVTEVKYSEGGSIIFQGVIPQFDLVCERGSFGFISTSVIFAGFFLGSIFVSSISDKFGRKYPLCICGCLCSVFNVASAFAPAFWVFALFRAVTGFMIGAFTVPAFVLVTEYSGIRHRGPAGSIIWFGYVAGVSCVTGLAYVIRDWKQLTMASGAPGIFLLACWSTLSCICRDLNRLSCSNLSMFLLFPHSLTPESIRWFLKKGRMTEARESLSKVARVNGKKMPDAALKLIGRRKIVIVSFLVSTAGAIGALLLSDKAENDEGHLAGEVFMYLFVTKLSGDIAFTLVYIYSAELFPTAIRFAGRRLRNAHTITFIILSFIPSYDFPHPHGFLSASFSFTYFHFFPFCVQLTVNRYLPFGIMGGLSLVTAIVCMTLPETHNEPTIEDLLPGDGEDDQNENSPLISHEEKM
ncbi:organic cation/carnitine transporter 4-like [Orbicella faveolata]|uniref:organic cation/carnitine transporter 4-like n=1 Tax=Orbicella faveolata TaxID=48498 RepID=UPI0009E5FA4E|nr:organic cation/carnitine transporter 4-like [Orbicella faveolata]